MFGKIIDKKMVLSKIGEIVLQEWNQSFKIRTELFCECFIIMPDHIHGVLLIKKSAGTNENPGGYNYVRLVPGGLTPQSISSFVAGFKSHATKLINEYRNTPGLPVWLPRFHEHIIRTQGDLNRICKYIHDNPAKTHGRASLR